MLLTLLRRTFFSAAVMLILLSAARTAFFATYRVAGSSMEQALTDGDRILVGESGWLVEPVERGDTVVFSVLDEILVKRIVGCPGDTLEMARGKLIRNGIPVSESIPSHLNRDESFPRYTLLSGEYFVLGDHRRVSVDSRDFGPIGLDQVLGTVVLRMTGEGVMPIAGIAP